MMAMPTDMEGYEPNCYQDVVNLLSDIELDKPIVQKPLPFKMDGLAPTFSEG